MIRHIHAHEQIFTASVESNVMLPAEPPDLKGRGVVVVVCVRTRMSADLASLSDQFAILEPLQPDENGVEVSIEGSVEEMVERAVAAVNEYAAKVAAQSQQAE